MKIDSLGFILWGPQMSIKSININILDVVKQTDSLQKVKFEIQI